MIFKVCAVHIEYQFIKNLCIGFQAAQADCAVLHHAGKLLLIGVDAGLELDIESGTLRHNTPIVITFIFPLVMPFADAELGAAVRLIADYAAICFGYGRFLLSAR